MVSPTEWSEHINSSWSPVCSHYQGLQGPFLSTSEQFGDGRHFSSPCSHDCSALKQVPYDSVTFFCSGFAVEKVNLRFHPSAFVLWVHSTMYSRQENENTVVFLLFWDLLKEFRLLTLIGKNSIHMTAFLFFRKTWTLVCKLKYTWKEIQKQSGFLG